MADGGPDFVVDEGIEVRLDGSNSSDTENVPLSYYWNIIKWPVGSSNALSSSTAQNISFTPDLNGTYLISLVVNDGFQDSLPASVTVTASEAGDFTELTLVDTDLPYTPTDFEIATLIEIDLSIDNTLIVTSGYGINEPYLALYATYGASDTEANFNTNGSWTVVSASQTNPVSVTESPAFILQRNSDGQYYKITLDLTAPEANFAVRIDAIQAWNSGTVAGPFGLPDNQRLATGLLFELFSSFPA